VNGLTLTEAILNSNYRMHAHLCGSAAFARHHHSWRTPPITLATQHRSDGHNHELIWRRCFRGGLVNDKWIKTWRDMQGSLPQVDRHCTTNLEQDQANPTRLHTALLFLIRLLAETDLMVSYILLRHDLFSFFTTSASSFVFNGCRAWITFMSRISQLEYIRKVVYHDRSAEGEWTTSTQL
jgi:hypothetical protein